MQIFAFVFALVATCCFVAAYLMSALPRPLVPLGLALLTVAWMVQVIVLTGSHLIVH